MLFDVYNPVKGTDLFESKQKPSRKESFKFIQVTLGDKIALATMNADWISTA